jgi:hypothetical protein
MPSSTDERIEELCGEIRALCCRPFSEESEEKLRNLSKELAATIEQHLLMARSSLNVKRTAIWKLEQAGEQA